VDVVRILVYGWTLYSEKFAGALSGNMNGILIAASTAAFFGSYIGSKFVKKITFEAIQLLVGIMLLILGTAIALGLAY